jgi:hypothetical protein
MTQDEFVDRTGLSPVEVFSRWREIQHEYLATDEHKNLFCLKWLYNQHRDLTHCLNWLKENDASGATLTFLQWLLLNDPKTLDGLEQWIDNDQRGNEEDLDDWE